MKKITNYLIIASLCIMILSSCGKEGVLLKGTVLENGTDMPVAGVEVKIIGGKATELWAPPITFTAGTAVTDQNGRFSIRVDDADYFDIGKLKKDGYIESVSYKLGEPIKQTQTTKIEENGRYSNPTIYIDPAGTLHVVVENDPNVEGDFIRASIPGHSGALTTFSFFEDYFIVRANRLHHFNYRIDSNDIISDSLYVPAFDTTELKIIF